MQMSPTESFHPDASLRPTSCLQPSTRPRCTLPAQSPLSSLALFIQRDPESTFSKNVPQLGGRTPAPPSSLNPDGAAPSPHHGHLLRSCFYSATGRPVCTALSWGGLGQGWDVRCLVGLVL